jgi:hypothetical protein
MMIMINTFHTANRSPALRTAEAVQTDQAVRVVITPPSIKQMMIS